MVYQDTDGGRREIESGYELNRGGRVNFRVGAYDHSRSVVIDPVLAYSTPLGGSFGDRGLGIAVDLSDNAYVTGQTSSTNFPTANAFQLANGGGSGARDGFGARLLDLSRRGPQ